MNCIRISALLFCTVSAVFAQADSDPDTYAGQDRSWQFHTAAGTADTTAIWKSDPAIVAWATGHSDLQCGSNVASQWQTPAKAYGPAVGDSFDVVVLGRGGQITMSFANPITNGSGFDFAVFENSFSDTFLELAWVEVSTDGVHFVRFPNFSYTLKPVGAFGSVDPTDVHGLAGKYRQGYGTPFDLEQLQRAYDAAITETDNFDSSYKAALEANFPHLDLSEINYVRLVDIVGDGSAFDCEGVVIYDPFPTVGSAGFDLDAVAVLNEATPAGDPQTIDFAEIGHQRLTDGSLQLSASASSGLPVVFSIVEGPAVLSGDSLNFTGLGQVIVQASQPGDATFAPAVPVSRSFVIADALQHIYLEPIANQLTGASNVQFYARSSSGLPVSLFVDDGPMDAEMSEFSHLFNSGSIASSVTVRASQPGGESGGVTYAPAADVSQRFDIVDAGDPKAPQSFAAWQSAQGVSGNASTDSDLDGASDFEEYAAGTHPTDASDQPELHFEAAGDGFVYEFSVNGRAPVRVQLLRNEDLSDPGGWVEQVPEIISLESSAPGEVPERTLRLRLPKEGDQAFWRIRFEPN